MSNFQRISDYALRILLGLTLCAPMTILAAETPAQGSEAAASEGTPGAQSPGRAVVAAEKRRVMTISIREDGSAEVRDAAGHPWPEECFMNIEGQNADACTDDFLDAWQPRKKAQAQALDASAPTARGAPKCKFCQWVNGQPYCFPPGCF